jgi:hypothetical protein
MKFLEDGLRFYQDKLDSLNKKFQLSGEYNGTSEKVTSMCLVCGYSWESLPYNLIKNGCPCCALDTWLTMEVVQERLIQKGKTITVSGEYESYRSKVACSCNVCGLNWKAKIPTLLCTPTGCPTCAKTGFDPNKPGYLYYLRVSDSNQTYWKIGITNLSVKKRFRKSDREKITILYCHKFENGLDAYSAEQNILSMFKAYKAENVSILKSGNTELFTKDVLQMDHLFWGPI